MRKLFVKKANSPSNEKEGVHARTNSEPSLEKTLKRASTMPAVSSSSEEAVIFHRSPSSYARKPVWNRRNNPLREQHISLVKEKPSKTNLLDKPQGSKSNLPSKPVWTKGKLRDQKISRPFRPEAPNLLNCGLVEFSECFEEPNRPPTPPPKEPRKPRESHKEVHDNFVRLATVSASSGSLSLHEQEPFSPDWLSGGLLDTDTYRKPPILLPSEPTGPLSSVPRQYNPRPFPVIGSREAVPPEDLLPEYSPLQLASIERIIKQRKEEAEEDEERLRDRPAPYATKIGLSTGNIRDYMKFGAGAARQMSRNKAVEEERLHLMNGPAHQAVLDHSKAAGPQHDHIHEGSQDSSHFFAIPVASRSPYTPAEPHQHSHNASQHVHHRGESQASTHHTANPAIPVNTHVLAHSQQPADIAIPQRTPSCGGSQASRDPFYDDKAPQQCLRVASITTYKPTVPLRIPLEKIKRSPSTTNIGWPLPLQPYPSRRKDPSTEVPIYPHLRSDGSMEVKTDKDMPPSTQERYKGKFTKLKPSPPLEFGCPEAVPPNPRYYKDQNGEFRSYAQTHRLSASLGHNTRHLY